MHIKKSGLDGRNAGENKIVPGQFKGGGAGAGETSGGVSAAGGAFSSVFDAQRRKFSVEEIRQMIESLDPLVLKIHKSPSFKLYEEYKNRVKTILKQICAELYQIKDNVSAGEASSGMPRGFLIVISKTDEALAELEEKFRKKADLNILAKHSEIRGMLLDALL